MFTFVPGTIDRLIAWLAERGLECTNAVTFLREPVHGIENDRLDVEVGVEVRRRPPVTRWCRCERIQPLERQCTNIVGRTRACRRSLRARVR
jgi:hypothetical protein